ncbi:MAG TPA: hypothetical protein ACHBZ9_10735 [Arsenophonus nasoniae]|uniref:hypothetical protein n=1 Tax=Arsenophonus nasoniae TaxID=638 RepID=UPI0038790EFC
MGANLFIRPIKASSKWAMLIANLADIAVKWRRRLRSEVRVLQLKGGEPFAAGKVTDNAKPASKPA